MLQPLIVGGNRVPTPSTAPWSVLITIGDPSNNNFCTGSIIDATHVLTAAHCATAAPADYTVTAGIVDNTETGDRSTQQQRGVAAVRTHPGYQQQARWDDVAELVLSMPFDFSGSAVAPVALVGQSAEPAAGTTAVLYGWGATGSSEEDHHEHYLSAQIYAPYACPPELPWATSGLPSLTCLITSTGATCGGDSGGGLVLPTKPATLAAVEAFAVHINSLPGACDAGTAAGLTDLASPEIRQWLAGSESPPVAPRAPLCTSYPDEGSCAVLRTAVGGATASCAAPTWASASDYNYLFVDPASGSVLQNGPATFAIPASFAGRWLECVAVAHSAGGTSYASSDTRYIAEFPFAFRVAPSGAFSADVYDDYIDDTFHLTAADAAGQVVERKTLAGDSFLQGTVQPLAAGRYNVCLTADPVDRRAPLVINAALTACVNWATPIAAPRLSSLSVAPRTFRAARTGASVVRSSRLGTRVTYRLSSAANVRFTVQRIVSGRLVGRRCKAPSRRNRNRRRCTYYVAVRGRFNVTGRAGENNFRFSGRLNAHTLAPNKYRLIATPTAQNHTGTSQATTFTVLAPAAKPKGLAP